MVKHEFIFFIIGFFMVKHEFIILQGSLPKEKIDFFYQNMNYIHFCKISLKIQKFT